VRARTVSADKPNGQQGTATASSQAAVRLTTAAARLTTATDLRSRTAQLRPSYAACIRRFNSGLSLDYANWIADLILRFSLQHQLDPRLVIAIIAAESNFRLTATSPKGAMGLGQLMPGTAAGMGVSNAYDPEQNLAAAVKILRGNLDRYRGYGDKQFAMALAAYNAGSGAVKRHGGVPPYRETVNYIWKVYRLYKGLAPDMFR
jgi:soluble lytic murein transglycosylase-like protein